MSPSKLVGPEAIADGRRRQDQIGGDLHGVVPRQGQRLRIQEIECRSWIKAGRGGKIISVTYLPLRDPGQTSLVRDWIARGAHSVCLGIDTDVVYAYRRPLKDVAWSPT